MTTEQNELSLYAERASRAAAATRGLAAGIGRMVLPVLGVTTALSLLNAGGLGAVIGNSGAVRNALLRVQDAFEVLTEPLQIWVADRLEQFADWLGSPAVQAAMAKFWAWLADAASAAWPVIQELLQGLWNGLTIAWGIIDRVANAIGGWPAIFGAVGTALRVWLNIIQAFWGFVARIFNKLLDLKESVAGVSVGEFASNALSGVAGGIRDRIGGFLSNTPLGGVARAVGLGGGQPQQTGGNTTNYFLAPSVEQQRKWAGAAADNPTFQSRVNGGP